MLSFNFQWFHTGDCESGKTTRKHLRTCRWRGSHTVFLQFRAHRKGNVRKAVKLVSCFPVTFDSTMTALQHRLYLVVGPPSHSCWGAPHSKHRRKLLAGCLDKRGPFLSVFGFLHHHPWLSRGGRPGTFLGTRGSHNWDHLILGELWISFSWHSLQSPQHSYKILVLVVGVREPPGGSEPWAIGALLGPRNSRVLLKHWVKTEELEQLDPSSLWFFPRRRATYCEMCSIHFTASIRLRVDSGGAYSASGPMQRVLL